MQTGGRGHRNRGTRVPFVLAAGVGVDIGLTPDDGHGFGSRRAELDVAGTQLASEHPGRGRPSGAADDDSGRALDRFRQLGRRMGRQGEIFGREGHGTGDRHAVGDQGNVNGPVDPGWFGELPGAVEWVDDPHPIGAQPPTAVGPLLGQHGVVGASPGQ